MGDHNTTFFSINNNCYKYSCIINRSRAFSNHYGTLNIIVIHVENN